MKPILRIHSLLFAAASLATSQEQAAPATLTTTCILGDIPDGTPPPPESPEAEFEILPQDIISIRTHQQNGRTITVRQIKPIALPPPPAPVETAAADWE